MDNIDNRLPPQSIAYIYTKSVSALLLTSSNKSYIIYKENI